MPEFLYCASYLSSSKEILKIRNGNENLITIYRNILEKLKLIQLIKM